jgi:hypothetical protein
MDSSENELAKNDYFKMPPYRPLKVYAFDPTRGRTMGNYMIIDTPYERLQRGPVGRYLEVIDYDANNKCYYQPVDLDDPWVMLGNGLDPSESNPQFHQQMVYAVASETISRFESALGRPIKWSFGGEAKRASREEAKEKEEEEEDDYSRKLRILPHAVQDANAYYDDDLGALIFGYFPAFEKDSGHNLPGQTIFTCLSHDIVVHETAHALVDSQRDHFMEPTSADALAFHEAFADIVALFQHFMFKEPLQEMIRRTRGQIFQEVISPESPENEPSKDGPLFEAQATDDNPLVGLARQFGEAMGTRKALRSALGTRPGSNDLQKYFEPHRRGSILVAAIFDAFFSVYVRRTADLRRIAQATGTNGSSDELHPDLVNRLAEIATKTAAHFLNICIRALDYCPPVDILFGDFLRAMITADHDLFANDRYGYRAAIIDAFRSRGIAPEKVISYSEESLLWYPPEVTGAEALPRCEGLQFDVFNVEDKKSVKAQKEKNKHTLIEFARKNAKKLGLSTDLEIKLGSLHEMHRMTDDGKLIFDIVAQLIQDREVELDPSDPTISPTFTFRGGTTLIVNQNGWVRYSIKMSIHDKEDDNKNVRLNRQRDYLIMRQREIGLAPYADVRRVFDRALKADFGLIHRGHY